MRRHEVSDAQWQLIEPLLPPQTATTGRPPKDRRVVLNGMMWILRTGAPWRDLPERFGAWQTVYHYFNLWQKEGVYDRILEALQIRLDAEGSIDWDLWCVDGTSVRATRAAAGALKKVAENTRQNRATTRWVARAADSAANSTWSLTAREFRLPSKSPRGKRTNRNTSSR